MDYATFKALTSALLVGDRKLPSDTVGLRSLVGFALTTVAMKADSLHLMTLSTTVNVLRLAQGDYALRMPVAPTADIDLIDIDEELVFAVARFLASYISRDKGGIHVQAANRLILDYNAKTWEIIEQMQLEADQVGVADLCYAAPSTVWTV